jgi:hypothetical protein
MYKRKAGHRGGPPFELALAQRAGPSGICGKPGTQVHHMLSGNRPTNTNRSRSNSSKAVPTERRSRSRLRDLCDEVLASYRVANEREVITDSDRAAARTMLARIAPLTAR